MLRIAYDRNGDGDYADVVGGTPETFTPFSTTGNAGRPCGGIAFDGAGRLAAVFSEPSASLVRVMRDMNADGDFSDAVDTTGLWGTKSSASTSQGTRSAAWPCPSKTATSGS